MHRIALALIAVLCFAPAAHADSIVYTKGSDVWVAAGDGSGQRQVTKGLAYLYPTQSDDGTILARRGRGFDRLDRQGHVLSSFASVAGGPVMGPWNPDLSPDGTKVAYWVGVMSSYFDPSTGIHWKTPGSFVIWQDALNGAVLGITNFYEYPSWIDNSRALLWDEGGAITPQVVISGVAQDHNDVVGWFRDSQTKLPDDEPIHPIGAGELTRNGRSLAVVRGGAWIGNSLAHGPGNHIAFYRVNGFDQLPTQLRCWLSGPGGGQFDEISWAPSGAALAWDEPDGIWSTAFNADSCPGTMNPHLTIPGGNDPDWGPAEPGVDAPDPASQPLPGPAPQPSPPALAVSAKLSGRVVKVTVSCPVACTLKMTDGRRALASRKLAAGRRTVSLRLKKRPRRPLTVAVAAGTASAKAKVKR